MSSDEPHCRIHTTDGVLAMQCKMRDPHHMYEFNGVSGSPVFLKDGPLLAKNTANAAPITFAGRHGLWHSREPSPPCRFYRHRQALLECSTDGNMMNAIVLDIKLVFQGVFELSSGLFCGLDKIWLVCWGLLDAGVYLFLVCHVVVTVHWRIDFTSCVYGEGM